MLLHAALGIIAFCVCLGVGVIINKDTADLTYLRRGEREIFVLVEDGKYYIVGTNDRDINTVDCYVTEDFVNYTVHNDIFKPSLYDGWENSQAEVYAPEIYLFDGVYDM